MHPPLSARAPPTGRTAGVAHTEHSFGGGHAALLLTARQKAVAGDFHLEIPIPPMKLVAEAFEVEVEHRELDRMRAACLGVWVPGV